MHTDAFLLHFNFEQSSLSPTIKVPIGFSHIRVNLTHTNVFSFSLNFVLNENYKMPYRSWSYKIQSNEHRCSFIPF